MCPTKLTSNGPSVLAMVGRLVALGNVCGQHFNAYGWSWGTPTDGIGKRVRVALRNVYGQHLNVYGWHWEAFAGCPVKRLRGALLNVPLCKCNVYRLQI